MIDDFGYLKGCLRGNELVLFCLAPKGRHKKNYVLLERGTFSLDSRKDFLMINSPKMEWAFAFIRGLQTKAE